MDQCQTAYTFVLTVYWPTIMLFLFLIHLSGKKMATNAIVLMLIHTFK